MICLRKPPLNKYVNFHRYIHDLNVNLTLQVGILINKLKNNHYYDILERLKCVKIIFAAWILPYSNITHDMSFCII